jgi:hypothetical protein
MRGAAKSGGISGKFGDAGSDLGALGAVRMKIVSHYRRTAGRVYDPCPCRAFSRRVARVQVKGEQRTTRVNTARPCYMDFFDVTVSWTGSRIRDEGSAVSPPTL